MSLSDHKHLYAAIAAFIKANSNFESTVILNATLGEIGACTDLQTVFDTPLKYRLFTMNAVLRWLFFMSVAPDYATQKGDNPIGHGFSPQQGVARIASVYDIGVRETMEEFFVTEDEGSEIEDEGSELEDEGSEIE